MNFTLFMVFSTIEGIGLFTLILSVFRFNPTNYVRQVLLASVMLSSFSYMLRFLLGLQAVVPFLLLILTIVFVWLLFDIKLYYAALMVVTGYLNYMLFQSVLLSLFHYLDFVQSTKWFIAATYQGDVLQFLSSACACVLSYGLFKKGWGFSFSFQSNGLQRRNLLDISIVILSILSSGSTFFFFFKGYIDLYLASLVLIITDLVLLVILLIRREKKND